MIKSPGGFTHEARSEIWAGSIFFPSLLSDKWCVQARFVNISTPGANSSSWEGDKYETSVDIVDFDLDKLIKERSISGFTKFLRDTEPDRENDDPISSIGPRACQDCRGGTIQTDFEFIDQKVIKYSIIHLYGKHTFTVGNWSETVFTNAKWRVLSAIPDENADISNIIVQIGIELVDEFSEDVINTIKTWARNILE